MENTTLSDFIDVIKKRPGMYVYSEGITELYGILRGFQFAKSERENILEEFDFWLKSEKYNKFEGTTASWCRILLFYYSSENRAMEQFFLLWDEFRGRH